MCKAGHTATSLRESVANDPYALFDRSFHLNRINIYGGSRGVFMSSGMVHAQAPRLPTAVGCGGSGDYVRQPQLCSEHAELWSHPLGPNAHESACHQLSVHMLASHVLDLPPLFLPRPAFACARERQSREMHTTPPFFQGFIHLLFDKSRWCSHTLDELEIATKCVIRSHPRMSGLCC